LVGRVVFHGGALVSLVLATWAAGMWVRSRSSNDAWWWVAQEKAGGVHVREVWEAGTGSGYLWLGAVREVSALPDSEPAEPPLSSRFLPGDNEPRFPPLLPTVSSQALYRWDTPPSVRPLLPRTSFASRYRFPALLSVRKRYPFVAGTTGVATGEWSTPYFAGREWGLVVPLWLIVAVFAVWPTCWEFLYRRGLYRKARERWRRERRLCPACGYDLRAAVTGRCPECGLVGAVGAAGA
jgi:hypothetical protein